MCVVNAVSQFPKSWFNIIHPSPFLRLPSCCSTTKIHYMFLASPIWTDWNKCDKCVVTMKIFICFVFQVTFSELLNLWTVIRHVMVPWIDTTVSFCLFQALAHAACCKNVMLKWITRHTHRLQAVLLSLSLPQMKVHSSIKVVRVFSRVQVAQSYTVMRGICCIIFVANVVRFRSSNVTTVRILAKGNMISRDTLDFAMKKNTS
jgi:hypothetical protein